VLQVRLVEGVLQHCGPGVRLLELDAATGALVGDDDLVVTQVLPVVVQCMISKSG
jgi:hypothetical protein